MYDYGMRPQAGAAASFFLAWGILLLVGLSLWRTLGRSSQDHDWL